jgi:hypothetical protein
MVYKADENIEPFWAEYASDSNGRDPLSVQNSSVVIYAKIIKGITNVTNRIRYKGFYCWLIDAIMKEVSDKDRNSLDEQIRYIRRGELLLAFIMAVEYPEVTGVSGSLYAKNNKDNKIDIKLGADLDARNPQSGAYWKLKTGAFGQYFIGSMRDLSLINYPQSDLNIYTLTKRGKKLTNTFSKNIPHEAASIFMRCILKNNITLKDLGLLKSFSLSEIPIQSDEHIYYQQMLLDNDSIGQTNCNRRNSIILLLKYLKEGKEDISNLQSYFLKGNYNANIQKEEVEEDTSTAWYLYEMSELLHVAYEYIHCNFLSSLEQYPQPLFEKINSLLDEASEVLKECNIDPKTCQFKDYMKLIKEKNLDVYDEHYTWMEDAYYQNESGNTFVNAINVMIQIYFNSEKHFPKLKEYASKYENNFNRNGYAIELIEMFIETKKSLNMYDYMKQLLLMAINQHTFSSYRKTQIGQNLVHNFMIEDDTIWRLREIHPSRTSPRLQNVTQYMVDLGWIKKENKILTITSLGEEIANIV